MAFALYDCWLEIVQRRGNERAVWETGRWLDFNEINARLAARPRAKESVVARTGSAGFFVEILRAWRDGQAVVPVEKNGSEAKFSAAVPRGMALVKSTPGAAGVPRGIWFSPEAVAADGNRLVREMGMTVKVPNIAVVSLAHSYGFSSVVLPLLLHGVPVILAEAPFPAVMETALLAAEGTVMLPAVPPMWRAWLRCGRLGDWPIGLAISAGSPLPLELEQTVFDRSGLKIHNFYGASECGGIAWDASAVPRTNEDSVGQPFRGVSVETDESGRIRVSSDAVGAGYEKQRAGDALGGGVFLTRDLGRLDEEGLSLSGKLCGAINVAGRKVSPAKVEAAIFNSRLVKRVKVIGFPSRDAERFEEIAALVELEEAANLGDLKRQISEMLPLWEVPRRWLCGNALWCLNEKELSAVASQS